MWTLPHGLAALEADGLIRRLDEAGREAPVDVTDAATSVT
jgi:hypothetical protein